MTEEEARTKWCPFARQLHIGAGQYQFDANAAGNRPRGALDACECIASECMAWRWSEASPGEGCCGLAGTAGALNRPEKGQP